MNRKELREAAREDLDDIAKPYGWSDSFLNRAANEAEREACRRARLLVDSEESEITRIETQASERHYALDPRVIFVRRVLSSRRTIPIEKIRTKDMDCRAPGWESHEGEITHYLRDQVTGKLTVYRKPTADTIATLSLTVVRLPLKAMDADGASPEIHVSYHESLRHWMVYRAYMKPDEDTYRPDKAREALARFEAEFGKPSSAQDEEWITEQHHHDLEEGIY